MASHAVIATDSPAPALMSSEPITFSFGENWDQFAARYFSDERVRIAQEHLLEFLGVPNLQEKYFLDVGCGSGLHSLAALRAGAGRIVSFDVDPASVRTTRRIREPQWPA